MPITTVVTTTAQLLLAVSNAHAGDTVLVAPGTYAGVQLTGVTALPPAGVATTATQINIRSEFASAPATLTSLLVAHSTGLNFSDLVMSTANTPVSPYGPDSTLPFAINGSNAITLNALAFRGNPAGSPSTDATGLAVEYSTNVTVENSSFEYMHNGIAQIGDDHIVIAANTFDHIDDDGVRGGGTSNIIIEHNTFTDQHTVLPDADHPDAIQFWTTNTTTSASNITIYANTIIRGTGAPVQGIFLRDEVGDLPYYNVRIDYNTLIGESYNGITLFDGRNSIIVGNNVVSYVGVDSAIKLFSSSGIDVAANSAQSFDYVLDTAVTVANNRLNGAIAPPAVRALNVDLPAGLASDVPEPSAWTIMLTGLGGVGSIRRMKRRSAMRLRATPVVG